MLALRKDEKKLSAGAFARLKWLLSACSAMAASAFVLILETRL